MVRRTGLTLRDVAAPLNEVEHRQVNLHEFVTLLRNSFLPLHECVLDLGRKVLGAQGVDDLHSQVSDYPCDEELASSPVHYLH